MKVYEVGPKECVCLLSRKQHCRTISQSGRQASHGGVVSDAKRSRKGFHEPLKKGSKGTRNLLPNGRSKEAIKEGLAA